MNITLIYNSLRIKVREELNLVFAPIRRHMGGVNPNLSIISNNCWAGHVYRYFGINYNTPTVGAYFFSSDYVKFVKNLQYYLNQDLRFIKVADSKYSKEIIKRGQQDVPIGVLDDIEIIFLHYKSEEEAYTKWTRRKKRIDWENIYYKMSEMNLCTPELLREFDKLQTDRKILFVTKDYGLRSQVIFKEYAGDVEIKNDTLNFKKYINLPKFFGNN